MGFGKWIVGSMCAAGAVIAAPVILPTAGVSLLTSGIVGATAGSIYERQMEKARNEGKREGMIAATKENEAKYRKQEETVRQKEREFREKIEEYQRKLAAFQKKERLTEEEIKERDKMIDEMLEYIKQLEEEAKRDEGDMTTSFSEYIGDTKIWALALR